jgi:2',3'-cyclic-nucleotide 2'-phosphodiesterase (5'-nucleotidase family)
MIRVMYRNYDKLGGLAGVTTLIKREKAKLQNPQDCIVTLNGDFLSASALAVKYKGAHMIDLLK